MGTGCGLLRLWGECESNYFADTGPQLRGSELSCKSHFIEENSELQRSEGRSVLGQGWNPPDALTSVQLTPWQSGASSAGDQSPFLGILPSVRSEAHTAVRLSGGDEVTDGVSVHLYELILVYYYQKRR